MSSFRYRHIIWDWNGTLFDDAWLCVEVINGMLARRNLPLVTPASYELMFDFPVIDYYRKLGFDFSIVPFEELSDEFIAGYTRRYFECGLREGTREVLEMGRQRGLTQSILSAMKQEHLDQLVDYFGLRQYFTDIIGLSDHHAYGKTEVGKQWLAAKNFELESVLFVGDTVHDHEVAQALGVDCWHIYSGHHAQERLATSGVPMLDSLTALFENEVKTNHI